jgi:hypothetical protein
MTDQDGNTVQVGYKGMVMAQVVAILNNGTVVWQGAFSGQNFVVPVVDSHQGKGNWPGIPGG